MERVQGSAAHLTRMNKSLARSAAHLRSVAPKPQRRGPKPRTLSERQRTMDAMADDYSVRARASRAEQGHPPTIEDRAVLNRIAGWMAEDAARAQVRSAADEVA